MIIDDFYSECENLENISPVLEVQEPVPDPDEEILQDLLKYNAQKQKDKFQGRVRKDVPVDKLLIASDEVDDLLDIYIRSNFKTVPSFKSLLDQLKVGHIKRLRDIVTPSREEISSVLTTKDADLIDAYSNFSGYEIKKIVGFYDALMSECDIRIGKSKKLKKPRKKREIPVDKIVASVQFLNEFENLKSIHPREILGAGKVWVYNQKYKKLGCYYADNQDGLTIKGTTVQNFNQTRSVQKILRKPKDVLTKVVEGDSVSLNKIMGYIKTQELPLTGRLNKDTIILRVIK